MELLITWLTCNSCLWLCCNCSLWYGFLMQRHRRRGPGHKPPSTPHEERFKKHVFRLSALYQSQEDLVSSTFFCVFNSGRCETVQGLPEGPPGEKDLDTGSRPHPARPPATSTPWPARWPASHRGTQPWNTPPEMNKKNPLCLLCYLFVEVYLICYTAHEQYNNMHNGR